MHMRCVLSAFATLMLSLCTRICVELISNECALSFCAQAIRIYHAVNSCAYVYAAEAVAVPIVLKKSSYMYEYTTLK